MLISRPKSCESVARATLDPQILRLHERRQDRWRPRRSCTAGSRTEVLKRLKPRLAHGNCRSKSGDRNLGRSVAFLAGCGKRRSSELAKAGRPRPHEPMLARFEGVRTIGHPRPLQSARLQHAGAHNAHRQARFRRNDVAPHFFRHIGESAHLTRVPGPHHPVSVRSASFETAGLERPARRAC